MWTLLPDWKPLPKKIKIKNSYRSHGLKMKSTLLPYWSQSPSSLLSHRFYFSGSHTAKCPCWGFKRPYSINIGPQWAATYLSSGYKTTPVFSGRMWWAFSSVDTSDHCAGVVLATHNCCHSLQVRGRFSEWVAEQLVSLLVYLPSSDHFMLHPLAVINPDLHSDCKSQPCKPNSSPCVTKVMMKDLGSITSE